MTIDELTWRSCSFQIRGVHSAVGEMERSFRRASGVRSERILDTVLEARASARIEGGAAPRVGPSALAQEAPGPWFVVARESSSAHRGSPIPPLQYPAVLGRLKALGRRLGLDPPCARRGARG
jgi:hypothetical protein